MRMPQKCLYPWRREAPSILMSGLHAVLVTMWLHPFRHSGRMLDSELPWLLPQHCSLGWAGMVCLSGEGMVIWVLHVSSSMKSMSFWAVGSAR